MVLTKEEFEDLAQTVFESLPEMFQQNMENVHIVVENQPTREVLEAMRIYSPSGLLGLYQGVPLTKRGTWYGMYAIGPDTITLYKKNIERDARSIQELTERIRSVLIHEIAHYYGMDENQVRAAGY